MSGWGDHRGEGGEGDGDSLVSGSMCTYPPSPASSEGDKDGESPHCEKGLGSDDPGMHIHMVNEDMEVTSTPGIEISGSMCTYPPSPATEGEGEDWVGAQGTQELVGGDTEPLPDTHPRNPEHRHHVSRSRKPAGG